MLNSKLVLALLVLALSAAAQITQPGGGGITIDTTAITGGAANRCLFESATNKVSEDSQCNWDAVNHELKIGGSPLAPFAGLYLGPNESTLPAIIQGYTGATSALITSTSNTGPALGVVDSVYGQAIYAVTASADSPNGVEGDAIGIGGGSIPFAEGLIGLVWSSGAGTSIVTASGIDVRSPIYSDGGVIVNLYGLRIEDQTGATNNWAIQAGLGKIEFDDLKTTGAATGKKVVCVDTATGILYTSSTGTDCSN